ncbi:MAG: ABC transporter permease/substrate-binding protein [Myxococcota bacterium]
MSGPWAELPGLALAHLQLVLVALGLGAAIAIPLGVVASRRARTEALALGTAGVLQTVPSLALLALMVPLLAVASGATERALGFALPSIGFLPAALALTLYGLLPMLRNTVAGLRGVDPALREAALGVGMTPRQSLVRVELPLALPVIVAGVRTATVWIVGTATLATPVGAASLGNLIFAGLQTRSFGSVVAGSAAAAALALVLDGIVRALERGVAERSRARVALAGAALAALVAIAIAPLAVRGVDGARAPRRAIAIGAKSFTEQYVLAAVLAQWIERETGRPTRAVESLGSTVAFDALRDDAIDVYVDYSGTIWATVFHEPGLPSDRGDVLAQVRARLARDYGVRVAAALGFENTYAIAMREARARELGIETIGDFARHSPALAMAGDYEFFGREEWRALVARYDIRLRQRRAMDASLMVPALVQGEVDAISAYSTDGRIASLGLRVLRDEKGVIPPYDAIVLASARLAREEPAVLAALARLDGAIDAERMRRMNDAVEGEGRAPAEVAAELVAERLGAAAPDDAGRGRD